MRSPKTGYPLEQLDGTADDIVTRGQELTTLAATMHATSTRLTRIGDSSVHKSKGTDKLAEMASETATDLADAAKRYDGTGTVLVTYGGALDVAQSWLTSNMTSVESAEQAYQNAKDAQFEAAAVAQTLSWRAEDDDDESQRALTNAQSAADTASADLASAETRRNEAWTAFDDVFETWSDAYEDAVDGIENAIDSAGNNDGFWEFVDDLLNVIAIVLIVLTVIALVIGAPLTGLLATVILVLAVASFALTALKFAYGRASLSDLAWSAVGLLPFGVGRLLSRGVPTLAGVMQGGRTAVTAAIRANLPRLSLLRPTSWATPARSLFAPVRSWMALPKPSLFTNPMSALRLGGSETAQVSTFLNTMRNSQWATNPGVQQFINATAGSLPGAIRQGLNVTTWTTFGTQSLFGVSGGLPEIPGLRDVRVS